MKDVLLIIRRNFLSPIVIAILVLAGILLALNEKRDAWFISFVIVVNTLLAIVQEIRAERALKKLELLSAPRARRKNQDGTYMDIMFDQLVVGDYIKLMTGDEVPADGEVISNSGLELDEGILTGESAAIEKTVKAVVYGATTVVAGTGIVCVTAVGINTKAGQMTATLKHYKPRLTPLQRAIGRAITWLTYGALLLAILIFVVYYSSGADAVRIFKTITAAAVTVVPEGLLLASSLLLAFGSLKLAQAKVLPQKLAAIEAMALLNILCVDKTGTLTGEDVKFESLELIVKTEPHLADFVGIVAFETSSGNTTGDAIVAALGTAKDYKVIDRLSFSSKRKLSGLRFVFNDKQYTVYMGAPEFLERYIALSSTQNERINELTARGQRVLLVVMFDDQKASLKNIVDKSGYAVALVILSNELRDGVTKTVAYLQKEGVSIRVISGDHPATVKYIASSAGINNAGSVVTGDELAKMSDRQWDDTAKNTAIFARVLPEQKERLIATFKQQGNFTGMVGDGVNDALALKKSDLGIAMYAGATATRRVADIVLMDNSFNSLPLGMRLGNRIIQAIEMIAVLFFHKIIYGTILLLSTLLLGVAYPFQPRHITFMNIFLVTMPTVMWTLFVPHPRHRLSPHFFWRDTLLAVAPIAAISGIVVTLTYSTLRSIHPLNIRGVATTTVIVATFLGVYLVFLVPKMFDVINNKAAKLARALYISFILIVLLSSFGVGFIREFFDFSTPAWRNMWPLLFVIIGAVIVQWRLAVWAGRRFKKREP